MREREREREKSACTREIESVRKRFGSSFYMFFPPPGPALCKLGLARSAVLPEVFTLVLGPSFDLPCLLATTILDSFSLFYLPNSLNDQICCEFYYILVKFGTEVEINDF